MNPINLNKLDVYFVYFGQNDSAVANFFTEDPLAVLDQALTQDLEESEIMGDVEDVKGQMKNLKELAKKKPDFYRAHIF